MTGDLLAGARVRRVPTGEEGVVLGSISSAVRSHLLSGDCHDEVAGTAARGVEGLIDHAGRLTHSEPVASYTIRRMQRRERGVPVDLDELRSPQG